MIATDRCGNAGKKEHFTIRRRERERREKEVLSKEKLGETSGNLKMGSSLADVNS